MPAQRSLVGRWWSRVAGWPLATSLGRFQMEITLLNHRAPFPLLTGVENRLAHPLQLVCTADVADGLTMNPGTHRVFCSSSTAISIGTTENPLATELQVTNTSCKCMFHCWHRNNKPRRAKPTHPSSSSI